MSLFFTEVEMRGHVDCSKVYVDHSSHGDGVFAAVDIAAGEIVERGIVRRLPASFDGHDSPHVFTWSDDRTSWAIGSGCSTFYNFSPTPNTEMSRDFTKDTFEIRALRDIAQDEELRHTYKSLSWRQCFSGLDK